MLVTHNGSFHADDAFATAVIKKIFPDLEIVRTRDSETIEKAKIRLDVGEKYNPLTGDFDHHQAGRAGERSNGVPYASFGLVWKEYGEQISGSSEVAAIIDNILVQPVDAGDNGMQIIKETRIKKLHPYTVSRLISSMNPTWEEEQNCDNLFLDAVHFASCILDREISRAKSLINAKKEFTKFSREGEGDYLILEKCLPWQEVVISDYPEVLYVIYPDTKGGWRVNCVSKALGSFENKQPLPVEWGGKTDVDLQDVTGVSDAIFCHTGLFTAGAKTFEGIEKMVKIALGQIEPQ